MNHANTTTHVRVQLVGQVFSEVGVYIKSIYILFGHFTLSENSGAEVTRELWSLTCIDDL